MEGGHWNRQLVLGLMILLNELRFIFKAVLVAQEDTNTANTQESGKCSLLVLGFQPALPGTSLSRLHGNVDRCIPIIFFGNFVDKCTDNSSCCADE